ncbi:MAG: sulfite exporter TauE/SafE family protein [Betaproteobacteria bacterium]|nr:MAG: sulfite exporter TauE/SafE family protein [Betaproteobacteria bacterium]
MSETAWLAALLLGLAGGAHCAGMCGGIVGALSISPGARSRPLAFTAAYHAGRATSYAAAGAIVGALGQAGLALRGSLASQHVLFAIASVALLAAGLYVAGYAPFVRRIEAAGSVLWRRIEPFSRSLIPATTPGRAALLGLLWGWLPCGMVYGALLLALGAGSIGNGILTMAAFALGTMPSLLAVGLFARSAQRQPARRSLRRIAGVSIAAVGAYGLIQLGLHAAALHDICRLPFAS